MNDIGLALMVPLVIALGMFAFALAGFAAVLSSGVTDGPVPLTHIGAWLAVEVLVVAYFCVRGKS